MLQDKLFENILDQIGSEDIIGNSAGQLASKE